MHNFVFIRLDSSKTCPTGIFSFLVLLNQHPIKHKDIQFININDK